MSDDDMELPMKLAVGADFAVSKADKANRTSFTIGGTPADNSLKVLGQRVGRWDITEIVDQMFEIQEMYEPGAFYVEDGVIWKALDAMLRKEMLVRRVYLMCIPLPSTKDKAVRGRSLQKKMKAGAVSFDKEAHWYPDYEAEMLRFTGHSEARLDDQFDSSAVLSRGLDTMPILEEDDFLDEEELSFREQARLAQSHTDGRSAITGY